MIHNHGYVHNQISLKFREREEEEERMLLPTPPALTNLKKNFSKRFCFQFLALVALENGTGTDGKHELMNKPQNLNVSLQNQIGLAKNV